MRNRVMAVDDLDLLVLDHLDQLVGEVEGIRRIAEERVFADIDRMKLQVRPPAIDAKRQLIRDQMHLMAAIGEQDRQFGGDNAAAAVSWITDDRQSHGTLSSF